MFFRLLLLFTVTPVIELFLLIRLGSAIGALPTVALVLATGVLGAALARTEGFVIIQKINARMAEGGFPAGEMIDGLCVLIAGVVLITPGIITDVFGFLLLLPPSRAVIKRFIIRYFEHSVKNGTVRFSGTVYTTGDPGRGGREEPVGPRTVRSVEDGEATFVDRESEKDST